MGLILIFLLLGQFQYTNAANIPNEFLIENLFNTLQDLDDDEDGYAVLKKLDTLRTQGSKEFEKKVLGAPQFTRQHHIDYQLISHYRSFVASISHKSLKVRKIIELDFFKELKRKEIDFSRLYPFYEIKTSNLIPDLNICERLQHSDMTCRKNNDCHKSLLYRLAFKERGDYLRRKNTDEYFKYYVNLSKYITNENNLKYIVSYCPYYIEKDIFSEIIKAEEYGRDAFLDDYRIDGHRLEGNYFSWKLLTPGGYRSGTFVDIPPKYEMYRVDRDKVFSEEKINNFHKQMAQKTVDSFSDVFAVTNNETLAWDLFVRIMRGAQNKFFDSFLKVFTQVSQKHPKLSKKTIFKAFQDGQLDSLSETRSVKMNFLFDILSMRSMNELTEHFEEDLSLCNMSYALEKISFLEEQFLSLYYKKEGLKILPKDHWAMRIDFSEYYFLILDFIRSCPDSFPLLKQLHFAYERSQVAVNIRFRMELNKAGIQAKRVR